MTLVRTIYEPTFLGDIEIPRKQDLKCHTCNNYLSVFPLRLTAKNESICGRCAVPSGTTAFQNEAVETILQTHKFPCLYEARGCKKELYPIYMARHEVTCPFRTIPCVFHEPPCTWKGYLSKLSKHCAEEHAERVNRMKGIFDIPTIAEHRSDFLLEVDSSVYFVAIRGDWLSKTLLCLVYTTEEVAGFKPRTCSISLEHEGTTLAQEFKTCSYYDSVFTKVYLHSFLEKTKHKDFFLSARLTVGQLEGSTAEIGVQVRPQSDVQYDRLDLKCVRCEGNPIFPEIYCCRDDLSVICKECHPGE